MTRHATIAAIHAIATMVITHGCNIPVLFESVLSESFIVVVVSFFVVSGSVSILFYISIVLDSCSLYLVIIHVFLMLFRFSSHSPVHPNTDLFLTLNNLN